MLININTDVALAPKTSDEVRHSIAMLCDNGGYADHWHGFTQWLDLSLDLEQVEKSGAKNLNTPANVSGFLFLEAKLLGAQRFLH